MEFKIGDKVRVNQTPDAIINDTGTIIKLSSYDALIEFDNWSEGHSGNRARWFVQHRYILPKRERFIYVTGDE